MLARLNRAAEVSGAVEVNCAAESSAMLEVQLVLLRSNGRAVDLSFAAPARWLGA